MLCIRLFVSPSHIELKAVSEDEIAWDVKPTMVETEKTMRRKRVGVECSWMLPQCPQACQ